MRPRLRDIENLLPNQVWEDRITNGDQDQAATLLLSTEARGLAFRKASRSFENAIHYEKKVRPQRNGQ